VHLERADVIATLGTACADECDHIREMAEPRLQRSGVVDTDTGNGETNDVRTSYGMFFGRGEDEVITGG
jgi:prolyl 4-hydroxylase